MADTPAHGGRRVRARRITFTFPSTMERHFADDDLVLSHAIAVLSAMFPEGEEFFVRSVRRYSDQVTDPTLKSQVAGFIGQEVTHGREHRTLNTRLAEMGYPTRFVEQVITIFLKRCEKWLPARVPLAMTAAFEHYTATFADLLLSDERARDLLTSDEIRGVLLWHAYEEVEHKAVAFDVLRMVGASEALRIWSMRVVSVIFAAGVIAGTTVSLARDRASYNPIRLGRSLNRLRDTPWLTSQVFADLRAYNRRGFHPSDFDTEYLLDTWHAELFGDQGRLAGNLR